MNKNEKKNRASRLSPVAKISFLLLAVALLAVGVTVAKYIWEKVSNHAQVTSNSFYFTVDLLGDSQMVESESGHYAFEESQSGTWNLYGGVEHNVTLNVQNFNDDLRITQNQIKYTALVTMVTPKGDMVTGSGVTLKKGETVITSTAEQTMGTANADGVFTKQTDTLTLAIPANSESNAYVDGTKVTVTISSSSPYEKTIKLNFVLYTMQTGLFYKIIDAPNNPYAELILINGVIGGENVQPTIKWCNGLSIDNTNELIYTRDENGNFVQQAGIENREMQISRALRSRESVSIYFFKADQTKDYTKGQTEVQISGTTYTIEIVEPSQQA